MKTVAAFDFDGTITFRDTLFPFLLKTVGYTGLAQAILKSSPSLVMFVFGVVSNEKAKQSLIRSALRGRSANLLRKFSRQWVKSIPFQSNVIERLKWHKDQGHQCVLISASVDIYVEEVAGHLGFDGVACTGLAVDDNDIITGEFSTPNCWGEQKILRLVEIVGPLDQVCLYAYGDSAGDLPMLRAAQHAWIKSKPFKKS